MNTPDYALVFLARYLPSLPWPIVKEVLQLLPAELIRDTLLGVPLLRRLIVDLYYSKELHLILSPTDRPHTCVTSPHRPDLVDISSYGEVCDFFESSTDVLPETIKIYAGTDFQTLEDVVRQYSQLFTAANHMQLYLDRHELQPTQLATLFCCGNLQKLQTSRVKLAHVKQALSEEFQRLEALEDLVLLGHDILDWSAVALPPNLKHLDLSWYSGLDVALVALPGGLEDLYWNQVGLHDATFRSLAFPARLRTLMLTNNSLHTLDVSGLPQTLQTVDFSSNNLRKFTCTPGNVRWPPRLESIILNNNLIDDASLAQLRGIEWPATLKNLRLDFNCFTTLQNLDALPVGLTYLDLSDTPLRTLEVSHSAKYPYFEFPESLELLNMQCCHDLSYETGSADARVRFPAVLRTLNLTESNCDNLARFVFPTGLKSLALAGNRIRDLNAYNCARNGQIVSWSQLECLVDLDLFYNLIEDLRDWDVPPALRRLDLLCNHFKVLSSVRTPLFNKEYRGRRALRALHLKENQIRTIDPDFFVPEFVHTVDLSNNSLSQFLFTEAIGNHPGLRHLDLSRNQIEKIAVAPTDAQHHSRLSRLNLTKNDAMAMTPDQFYKVLGQIGIKPNCRKNKITTEHVLVQCDA
ncbi:L domain-like protein [Metschnikowia bicuspidata]|uniref:L domain-like protein n=1 Tax=Metschnikowia bicuspidata TaxID=27322 RepID=A0A4P9ZC81_9ASCO|nr:L domain-like protein [Metschnikowia bicuspidata]